MHPACDPKQNRRLLCSKHMALVLLAVGMILGGASVGGAAETPPPHQQHGSSDAAQAPVTAADTGCAPIRVPGLAESSLFEGIQIETSDIKLYEMFFEQILRVSPVQRMEHPQVDSLRGYCYRGVLIVVRQDLRTPRPTGWAQLNFAVADVTAVQGDLERAYRDSPVYGGAEAAKVVRFRLKPDVRRGDCRAARLEVSGPEGFMIGFDQYKEGSCATDRPEPGGERR